MADRRSLLPPPIAAIRKWIAPITWDFWLDAKKKVAKNLLLEHGAGVEQLGEIAARAQYYNNKLLASVVYFAEPIKTGL